MDRRPFIDRIPHAVVATAVTAGSIVAFGAPAHAEGAPPEPLSDDEIQQLFAAGELTTQEVGIGQTMYSIAEATGVSVDELMRLNRAIANPNLLLPGTQLNIPVNAEPPVAEPQTFAPPTGLPVSDMPVAAGVQGILTNQVGSDSFGSASEVAMQGAGSSKTTTAQRYADRALQLGLAAYDTVRAGVEDLLGVPQVPDSMLVDTPKPTNRGPVIESLTNGDSSVFAQQALEGITIIRTPDGTVKIQVGPDTDTTQVSETAGGTTASQQSTPRTVPQEAGGPSFPEVATSGTYQEYLDSLQIPIPQEFLDAKAATDGIKDDNEKFVVRAEARQEYIKWLFESVHPTLEGYTRFKESGIDMTYSQKFPIGKEIDPTCTVTHLMAGIITSPDQYVNPSVAYIILPGGQLYQLTPEANTRTGTTAGGNDTCVATEISAFDALDVDPKMALTEIYRIMYIHEKFGITPQRDNDAIKQSPLDSLGDLYPDARIMKGKTSVWGHKEFDRIENESGHQTGKVDPDVSFMTGLYDRLMDLYFMSEAAGEQSTGISTDAATLGSVSLAGAGGSSILDAPVVSNLEQLASIPVSATGSVLEQYAQPASQPEQESNVHFSLVPDARTQLDTLAPNLSAEQRDFLYEALEAGVQLQALGYNVNPVVMAGQLGLESGYGTSELAREAFNPLGMTTSDDDPSAYWHVDNGNLRPFKRFKSFQEAFQFYAEGMSSKEFYADTAYCLADPQKVLLAIQQKLDRYCNVVGGLGSEPRYAEATNYADRVYRLIQSLNLQILIKVEGGGGT